MAQRDAVLGPLGSGQGRLDRGQIELHDVGEGGLRRRGVAPHALGLGVGLDEGDSLRVASGKGQVVEGRLINREDTAGRPVLGRHVGDGRLVGQRKVVEPIAEKLDELADDAVRAEHLHHG